MTRPVTRAVEAPPTGEDAHPAVRRLRHPVAVWLTVVLAVVYGGLGVPRLLGYSVAPAVLPNVLSVLAFVLLFGGSVLATGLSEGRPGVRRLLGSLVRWRIGVRRWLLVLAALPALTLVIAAVTGTLSTPQDGWGALVAGYGAGLLTGLVLTTLWEEAAWSGFVQTRLMRRHGLLTSAGLTAVPFVLVHVPGAFQDAAVGNALVDVAAIAVLAPLLRYLAGVLLLETGGSVLAVAVLHASFNASGKLPVAEGGWQFLVALVLLTGLVALLRRLHRP